MYAATNRIVKVHVLHVLSLLLFSFDSVNKILNKLA